MIILASNLGKLCFIPIELIVWFSYTFFVFFVLTFLSLSNSDELASLFLMQVLDWMLGKGHAVLLRRAELKTFVDFHGNEV